VRMERMEIASTPKVLPAADAGLSCVSAVSAMDRPM
jgi:hypothetical protein